MLPGSNTKAWKRWGCQTGAPSAVSRNSTSTFTFDSRACCNWNRGRYSHRDQLCMRQHRDQKLNPRCASGHSLKFQKFAAFRNRHQKPAFYSAILASKTSRLVSEYFQIFAKLLTLSIFFEGEGHVIRSDWVNQNGVVFKFWGIEYKNWLFGFGTLIDRTWTTIWATRLTWALIWILWYTYKMILLKENKLLVLLELDFWSYQVLERNLCYIDCCNWHQLRHNSGHNFYSLFNIPP